MIYEASKNITLSNLLNIQASNYVGENGREYCKESIDQMIIDRYQAQIEREHKKMIIEFNKVV
tara:strand:+ start:146 stop:334 length:189 start_codon:yes stop_codon:yes gene_type:complete